MTLTPEQEKEVQKFADRDKEISRMVREGTMSHADAVRAREENLKAFRAYQVKTGYGPTDSIGNA